jgi:hypothetical protein
MSALDELRARYPRLYPPSLPDYALWVPIGWISIILRLNDRLEGKPIVVKQVKEKFGGLRFYFAGPRDDAETRAAIMDAETESWVTCDTCGNPGVLRETDQEWLAVRSDAHADGAAAVDPARRTDLPITVGGLHAPRTEGVARGFLTLDELE